MSVNAQALSHFPLPDLHALLTNWASSLEHEIKINTDNHVYTFIPFPLHSELEDLNIGELETGELETGEFTTGELETKLSNYAGNFIICKHPVIADDNQENINSESFVSWEITKDQLLTIWQLCSDIFESSE